MESLDPVIVELLKENVRLRGEIDRLKERLDNKARLMIFQEGYIDKQSQAIKTLKSDKYQKRTQRSRPMCNATTSRTARLC